MLEQLVQTARNELSSHDFTDPKLGDIDERTIRWWTTQGLLPRPGRNGRRATYDQRHLNRIIGLRLAQDTGWTVSELQRAVTDPGGLARLDGGKPPLSKAEPTSRDSFWTIAAAAVDPTMTIAGTDVAAGGPSGTFAATRTAATSPAAGAAPFQTTTPCYRVDVPGGALFIDDPAPHALRAAAEAILRAAT